jgi:Domain of unknown function (DUF1905)
MQITFKAPLWMWSGKGSWFFVTLPVDDAARIRFFGSAAFQGAKKPQGWGSIPVKVRLGRTEWQTSLFPDSKSGSYLLPVKADVRKAEGLVAGSNVEISLIFSAL